MNPHYQPSLLQPIYQYMVLSEIHTKVVPEKLEKIFCNLESGDTISTESLLADNIQKIPKYQSKLTFKRAIAVGIKVAHDIVFLQRTDYKFVPAWFRGKRLGSA